MYQSTTPSLSQTIWPRWASRRFLTLPIVQTLLPVSWLYSKLRGCRYETIEEMKEAVTKVIDTVTQEDFHGAFQKLLELSKIKSLFWLSNVRSQATSPFLYVNDIFTCAIKILIISFYDSLKRYLNAFRVILFLEVKESCVLYIHIYICWVVVQRLFVCLFVAGIAHSFIKDE